MWIQDWSGKIVTDFGTRVFWNWRWNETWYPNLDTVIRYSLAFLETKSFLWSQDPCCLFRDLDAEGVKVTAYVTAHLNVEGDVYTEAAAVSFLTFFPLSDLLLHAGGPLVEVHKWVPGKNVKVSKHDGGINLQLQQDYGHFTVATVDVTEVPPDCNCINTARIWSVS